MVWWGMRNPPAQWAGQSGRRYHPRPLDVGCTCRSSHRGDNKEVFDVEVFALYQALKTLETRNEERASYTFFSGSAAAFTRAMPDQAGPGQAFAKAII